MRSWVQSLMGVSINVLQKNEIYKHVHHNEYTNMYIMVNHVKFVFDKIKRKTLKIFHNMYLIY
jgi:hypothetical protein